MFLLLVTVHLIPYLDCEKVRYSYRTMVVYDKISFTAFNLVPFDSKENLKFSQFSIFMEFKLGLNLTNMPRLIA